MAAAPAPGLAPGRDCGTCTVCCKTFDIPEVPKMAGQWCPHVVQSKGCGIHATRPQTCRRFFCHWMRNGGLGSEWRPDRAKFLIQIEMEGRRMVVVPDTGSPAAWRRAPFYAQFKRWAALGAGKGHQILVFTGKRAVAVLPDRDQDLGMVEVGDSVIYRGEAGRIEADVVRRGVGR